MRVAIVGGGWAGLAAAVELMDAGVGVTLFEAAKQLGGRARGVDLAGRRFDNGQHILLGAYRETLRLLRRVGADPARALRRLPLELRIPDGDDSLFRLRLPPLPAPWHLAAGLLTATGASPREKIAAALFMRRLQGRAGVPVDDCSVAALLDRHNQRGHLRRHLWEALCLAALNTAPAQASARIFAHTLRDSLGGDRAATDLLLPTVDLSRLFPEAAAGFITTRGGEIRLRRRVEAIETLQTTDHRLAIHGEGFDAVVLAVAPQHAGALLARHPQSATDARLLAGYAFEPIGTVYCGYPPEVRLPFPMLGLATDSDEVLGQWVFDRGTLCGTAGVLAFVLSGGGRWQTLDNPRLAATLHRELATALRRRLPPFIWSHTIREQRATFSCRPGLPRPLTASARAGLWLAGDYVCADYPATLEAAVRSGVAAARGILGSNEAAGA